MQNNIPPELTALPEIKPLLNNSTVLCKRISGGQTNRCYRIYSDEQDWCVRINQPSVGANRQLEKAILEELQTLNLTVEVVAIDEYHLTTQWHEKKHWNKNDLQDSKHLQALSEQLKKFHVIPCDSIETRLDYRVRQYAKLSQATSEQLDQIESLIKLLQTKEFWQHNLYVTHFDLNPSNFLGKTPLIIDWEFIGQGHPLVDWTILEYNCQTKFDQHFPKNINPEWIGPCRQLVGLMMEYWPQNSLP